MLSDFMSEKNKRFKSTTYDLQTHVFCALRAFTKLQALCIHQAIANVYQISRELFAPVIRRFILDHHPHLLLA